MKNHHLRSLAAGSLAVLLLLTCGCGKDLFTDSEGSTHATLHGGESVSQTTGNSTTASASVAIVGSSTDASTTGTTRTITVSTKTGARPTGTAQTTSKTTTAKPTTPTKQPTQLKGQTKISDYIPQAAAWKFKGFPYRDDFAVEIQFLGYAPYYGALVEDTMRACGLGDTINDFTKNVETYEWPSNHLIGESILVKARPSTREQALDMVMDWLKNKYDGQPHPWSAMESFTRWQHYAGEAGYDYLGCEIGASVNCSNLSIAFTRGAAKQYNRQNGGGNVDAWFVDFSLWGEGGMVNYSEQNPNMYKTQDGYHNNVGSGPLYGQSPSAARRAYYMAYMAGTNWLINEAGGQACFYDTINEEGQYDLSPHGEVAQEFYSFSQRHSDRGVAYAPFAVMIPRDHGLPYGHWKSTYKPFDVFNPNDGDYMLRNIIQLIYPDSFPDKPKYEVGQQAHTPYGDTFDFLTQTANQQVLNSYPVIILAGDLHLSEAERVQLYNYVGGGGTLVMNTAYLGQFSSFSGTQNFGKGRVIAYGDDYDVWELDGILSDLTEKLLPVQVSGDIQYMVNIKDGSVVVTLINNLGVEKYANQPTRFDDSQTQTVTVTYTGGNRVLEVRDWITDNTLAKNKTQTLVLGPGDIQVIEFVA